MALPDVTITIQDGALGQVPASVANASAKVGICSGGIVGAVYSFSDIGTLQATLGQGPLVDAIAHTLAVAGGPVYAIPANPSAVGVNGSVTHTGPGTGTVAATLAPAQTIATKIVLGGANGTFTFQTSLGGGAYGPVTTTGPGGAPFAYLVPGTLTTLTFADSQTYVAGDVYTVDTQGGVTLTTGAGPAATNVTLAANPLDAYSILLTITTGGALGVGVFTYSVDGGNSTSGQISIPGGGKYAIPNTGIMVTFAGTFTAGDTYAWTTTAAGFSTADLTTALTALRLNAAEWGFVHVVATWANAAGAAAAAAIVDGQMAVAEAQYRFARGIIECPTTGADTDSVVAAAFANFSSLRTMVVAGDAALVSPLNGRILRRNAAWVVAAHLAAIQPGEHPGFVGSTKPLKNIASLYRDEQKTQYLDAQRFTTLRTLPGARGYFITRGNMMAPGGSDFDQIQRCRVMDVACRITRQGELPYLNGTMRINPTNGTIDERDAQAFEATVNAELKAGVVATGDASGSSVVLNRSANILSTSSQPVTVRIVPLGYMEHIPTNIGFSNPAIAP